MASFFKIGEKKTRPGVYYRYEDYGTPPTAGVDDGKCACVLRSNWGPTEEPVLLEAYDEIDNYYGDGGENGTTDVPLEQFKGGAKTVRAVRLGTGGTQGSYQILDTEGNPAMTLLLKYPGSRELSVTIRTTIDDDDTFELLILEGTTQLERLTFTNPEGEKSLWNLEEQWASTGSDYFKLVNSTATNASLATVDQEPITGGTDPTITIAAYTAAFELLESSRWNVLAIDTEDTSAQMMMQLFLNRIYDEGKWVIGVIGEATNIPLATRQIHASAYNDYQMVYVGNGFTDISGDTYEGYRAAARIAGLLAGTPSNESITHLAITGATDLTESLTNNQYETSINAGMLTFSLSAANTVWVEQGINTLVLPGTKEDEGWKKTKRTKVRMEVFQRLDDTVNGLVGRVNNDPDGRMTVIQASNNVLNAMVSEKKLLAGAYVTENPNYSPEGDSAWFTVYADDIDAMEKFYYNFKFRFAPN